MGGKESRHSQYEVIVKTIDKKYGGTDDDILLSLIGPHGKKSKVFNLDVKYRDDFEEGERNTFELKDFHDFGRVEKIEITLKRTALDSLFGKKDAWGLEWVLVTDKIERKIYEFPVHRWLYTGDKRRWSRFDTSLPQHDSETDQRKRELVAMRDLYKFKEVIPGVTPLLESLPLEEQFTESYKKTIKHILLESGMVAKLISFATGPFTCLDDMDSVYKFCFDEPKVITHWKSDSTFGRLQLTGCNPINIRLCTEIPENFGVTEKLVAHSLGNTTLEKAMKEKRVFISDYGFLRNVTNLHAPVCLYYVNDAEDLIPIAIQLRYAKCETNPVFVPTDPEYTWILAKLWFSVVDSNYHESCTHLAFTHFVIETITIAIHRHLSPSHPLFRLIKPHISDVLNMNWNGRKSLLDPKSGFFEMLFLSCLDGCKKLMQNGLKSWSFKKNGMLPNNLKERGLSDPKVLPKYYYRDDGLLLWDAIRSYVTRVVHHFYVSQHAIEDDHELKLFRHTLTKSVESGGCGLKDIPGDDKHGITSKEQIVDIFTTIIFISSANHAAVNFEQYEQFAFPPNFPVSLRGSLPNSKRELTEQDVVRTLPTKEDFLKTMAMSRTLSSFKTRSLGDFDVQYMYDPACIHALKEFRKELKKIGQKIDERNRLRTIPYTVLHPSNVPNSIAI